MPEATPPAHVDDDKAQTTTTITRDSTVPLSPSVASPSAPFAADLMPTSSTPKPSDTDFDLERDRRKLTEWVLALPVDKLCALANELPKGPVPDNPLVGWLWEAVRERLRPDTALYNRGAAP